MRRCVVHTIKVPTTKVKVTVGSSVRYKSCLCDSSLTTEANLMKLHRKIQDNKKVCRVPTHKVKVTIRSEIKIMSQH